MLLFCKVCKREKINMPLGCIRQLLALGSSFLVWHPGVSHRQTDGCS